jgi:hypothetical protein
LCADLRAQPLFLHAPGKDLIAEGIDEASRGTRAAGGQPWYVGTPV